MKKLLLIPLLVILAACWVPLGGSLGSQLGCEGQASDSSGFVLVETRCHGLQQNGYHQQAGVRCKGETWMQGGNMVYANGAHSQVERFCGNLGYEYAVLIYSN